MQIRRLAGRISKLGNSSPGPVAGRVVLAGRISRRKFHTCTNGWASATSWASRSQWLGE